MQRLLSSALLATMTLTATPTFASTGKFDCDAPAARFSHFSLPIAGQHVRVTGVISSQLVRKDGTWVPKLSLYLAGSQAQFGGFSISNQPHEPWALSLRYSGQESAPVATFDRFDALPFVLDVNSSTGTVDLSLGANRYHGAGTPFQAEQLSFSCSTGNFLFDQLSWTILPN